jgi:hypothetical protein
VKGPGGAMAKCCVGRTAFGRVRSDPDPDNYRDYRE